MSGAAIPESEDVNDFLQRIRELGDKRDKEDEERTKKLEEEILQGRAERQARRAERARSISPTKDSPSNTPHSLRSLAADTPRLEALSLTPSTMPSSRDPATREFAVHDAFERLTAEQSSTTGTPELTPSSRIQPETCGSLDYPSKSSPSDAVAPSRGSPLSWQRRPGFQASNNIRTRPLSQLASENNVTQSPRATPEPAYSESAELSRSQIAQSLSTKDPTWFKQTEERGAGSAAYRRNQDEPGMAYPTAPTKRALPGMSRESTVEPDDHISSQGSIRSRSPSRASSTRENSGWKHPNSNSSSISGKEYRSPLPILSAQRLEPPLSDSTSVSSGAQQEHMGLGHIPAMSPSQGRISPERIDRAPSPTKGLGGFVQSAMLKRSDSVNKRWSAQTNPGLSRGNSIVGSRGAFSGSTGDLSSPPGPTAHSSMDANPSNDSEGASSTVDQRADSPPSNPLASESAGKNEILTSTSRPSSPFNGGFAKPALPGHARTHSTAGAKIDITPPSSPSKTMDAKRWSPTKASWLESALNKGPETSRPKAPPPQQPSWMAEINKAKTQRASTDLGRAGAFKEISTGGLMRAPPPGGPPKPLSTGVVPSGLSSGTTGRAGPQNVDVTTDPSKAKSPPAKAKPSELSSKQSSPILRSPNVSAEPYISQDAGKVGTASEDVTKRIPSSSQSFSNESANSLSTNELSKPSPPPKSSSLNARAGLKTRQLPTGNSNDEPEFKNVFGRLKSTKTQNYVAPDELKSNILKGKAGLNVTGGPKKSERKDELKESILKKKEEMKAKAGEDSGFRLSRSNTSSSLEKERESSIPEAIAKKKSLQKPTSGNDVIGDHVFTAAPEAITRQKSIRTGQITTPSEKVPNSRQMEDERSSKPSKLTERFHPGLASLLAKGPPSMIGAPGLSTASRPDVTASSTLGHGSERPNSSSAGPLTHITKGRARGPKRRLPTSKVQDSTLIEAPSSPAHHKLEKLGDFKGESAISTASAAESEVWSKSPTASGKSIVPVLTESLKRTGGSTSSTSNISTELVDEEPIVSVRNAAALWGRNSSPLHPAPVAQLKSPVQLPSKRDEEYTIDNTAATTTNVEKRVGLGLQSIKFQQPKDEPLDRSVPSPPLQTFHAVPVKSSVSPKIPQKPSVLSLLDSGITILPPKVDPPGSPVPHTSEASRLFAEFFDGAGKFALPTEEVNVDTQALLCAKSEDGDLTKIKTLRKQIWELTGDGKQKPIAPHQEHILFEGSMYLCTHVFGASDGTRTTEVYLWAGSQVSDSSVQDAQLFSRKTANENKARLLVFRQGRETPRFFQALGGIVITRRGSSTKADSHSPYMLCGRRHLGQISFDEVDLSVSSLCSGFPYLISTPSGKLYLWKGKGSGADELGCARLIGMDLGLTGEIEEIEEGHETTSFFNVFGNASEKKIPKSADHWRLKPSYDKYRTRLFCVDHSTRDKVFEISPFCQADLDQKYIYCVDAFFEIYIVVGAKSQSRYTEFQTALGFAQEYGILAASLEDRPFVPVSTVVLQGVPRDFKALFRNWEEAKIMTSWEPRRSPSLRVVPLSAAIEATRS